MSDAHILQVIGLIYLLIGIGMLFDKKYLPEVIRDLTKSLALSWVFSILAILMGFLIVTRQAGAGGWSVLITVIGWIALFKGGLFMVAPKAGHGLLERVLKQKWIWALAQWIILLGGAVLAYVGFYVL